MRGSGEYSWQFDWSESKTFCGTGQWSGFLRQVVQQCILYSLSLLCPPVEHDRIILFHDPNMTTDMALRCIMEGVGHWHGILSLAAFAFWPANSLMKQASTGANLSQAFAFFPWPLPHPDIPINKTALQFSFMVACESCGVFARTDRQIGWADRPLHAHMHFFCHSLLSALLHAWKGHALLLSKNFSTRDRHVHFFLFYYYKSPLCLNFLSGDEMEQTGRKTVELTGAPLCDKPLTSSGCSENNIFVPKRPCFV